MPKKGKIKKSEAVNRIFYIEREKMMDDPLVQNWVEELIVNDKVKFIDYLTDKIFFDIIFFFHFVKYTRD